MAPVTLNAIAAPLRAYGAVVLEGYAEPHAEVMALVWGPRFDREHALRLLDGVAQRLDTSAGNWTTALAQDGRSLRLKFDYRF